jgi:hypothetical protein
MRAPWVCLVLVAACGPSEAEKDAECDAIAADIRKLAVDRGIPTLGACNSQVPRAVDLQPRCADLKRCQAEYDDIVD